MSSYSETMSLFKFECECGCVIYSFEEKGFTNKHWCPDCRLWVHTSDKVIDKITTSVEDLMRTYNDRGGS